MLFETDNPGESLLAFEDASKRVVQSYVNPEAEKHLDTAEAQFLEYFSGVRKEFDLPLDFSLSTEFQEKAQQALKSVPFGAIETYKDIAEKAGNVKATRAVGTAMAKNPLPIILPCHRVGKTDGSLGEYSGGAERKQWLRDFEALAV